MSIDIEDSRFHKQTTYEEVGHTVHKDLVVFHPGKWYLIIVSLFFLILTSLLTNKMFSRSTIKVHNLLLRLVSLG